MTLTRAQIESMAPDQAALTAAGKLMKPASWAGLGIDADGGLIWGECQGSGANPYRVMADLSDLGSKCTCPSRKFPCKHCLALMWIKADAADRFATGAIPEWVTEWLGRRRKGAVATPKTTGGASASLAESTANVETEIDPEAEAKKAAAAEKRAAKTTETAIAATEELEAWIADQLRLGLNSFLSDLHPRCRKIASRLVDGKAAALASRLDELPARVLALPADDRVDAVLTEFSKLILLVRAWRAAPDDAALKRDVTASETREVVLMSPDNQRVRALWRVAGERIETRRDGLVSHATWLERITGADGAPHFAVLLDFFPASAGKRASTFKSGDCFDAEIAFYAARVPLRAVIAERHSAQTAIEATLEDASARDPLETWRETLKRAPWSLETPVRLSGGQIGLDAAGKAWWRSADARTALPLSAAPERRVLALSLHAMTALWNGRRLEALSAQTDLGWVDFDA